MQKKVNGQETIYEYQDSLPVPYVMVTPCGDEFRYEYDAVNRLMAIQSKFGERSFGYDIFDHIVADIDALGNSYEAVYDLMGNLCREYSPHENARKDSRCWRYAYDGMDNPIRTKSPLGIVYIKEYDGESRLTKEIHPESWDEETKTGAGTTYAYDADGAIQKITHANGMWQDITYAAEGLRYEMEENGKLVQFIFDENKEVIAEKEDGIITRLICIPLPMVHYNRQRF
ncbi:MAG: hypothetical protein PUB49_09135 [Selenomonadaceae bacterium]|nr:hypothetical protein [Selenomonadaceae bacterium]